MKLSNIVCFLLVTLLSVSFQAYAAPSSQKIRVYESEESSGSLHYEAHLEDFVQTIMATGPAKTLLESVLEQGSVAVLSVSAEEAPAGATWAGRERTIRLSRTEPWERQLGHLMFELCNAEQNERIEELSVRTERGLVSREAYVETWERIEHDSSIRFYRILKVCLRSFGWPQGAMMDFDKLFDGGTKAVLGTWEKAWALIKDSNHADLYRKDWDRQVKKIYCARNPGSDDCRAKKKGASKN